MTRGTIAAGVMTLLMSVFFRSVGTAGQPGKDGLIVVHPNEGLDFFPGRWKVTKDQTGGSFSLVEVNDRATRETRPHVHTREDEAWYVIEGELSFEVGEQKATAGPGTFVYAPREVPHAFKVTKVPATYLILFSPAGIESFFAERSGISKRLREGTAEYEKQLQELRAKYGLCGVRTLQSK